MVRIIDDIRVIVEFLSSIILLIVGVVVSLVAAFMVGWQMALGMLIVFVLGYYRSKDREV